MSWVFYSLWGQPWWLQDGGWVIISNLGYNPFTSVNNTKLENRSTGKSSGYTDIAYPSTHWLTFLFIACRDTFCCLASVAGMMLVVFWDPKVVWDWEERLAGACTLDKVTTLSWICCTWGLWMTPGFGVTATCGNIWWPAAWETNTK